MKPWSRPDAAPRCIHDIQVIEHGSATVVLIFDGVAEGGPSMPLSKYLLLRNDNEDHHEE
jgi:hypothetical protein